MSAMTEVSSLTGRLLVATPALADPNFDRAVVLLLDHDGSRYIVDAGFGGLTLTAPLELEPDVAQPTPHERFRLRHLESDFVMEAELDGRWHPLYRFDLQPQRLADYEVSNWYLCNFPHSHFLGGIIAARTAPGRRYALRIAELTTHTVGERGWERLKAQAWVEAVDRPVPDAGLGYLPTSTRRAFGRSESVAGKVPTSSPSSSSGSSGTPVRVTSLAWA